MKKKVFKVLIPFLLTFSLLSRSVYAQEGTSTASVQETEVEQNKAEVKERADSAVSEEFVAPPATVSSGDVNTVSGNDAGISGVISEIYDSETGEKRLATIYTSNEGYTFYLSSGSAIISGYIGNETSLKIPSVLTAGSAFYNVYGIGSSAFSNNVSILSVSVPGTITSIGDYSFQGCISLNSVTINEGVTSIGYRTFQNCTSLKSIVIPSTINSISMYAFDNCISLEAAQIKTNFTGSNMFSGCKSLKSVTLANDFSVIGAYSFSGCISLSRINIPNSLQKIQSNAFYGCTALTSISLNEGLSEIGNSAFKNCTSLSAIIIPSTVAYAGDYSFEDCTGLKAANIKCSELGYKTFSNCTGLQSVTFSNNLKKIGGYSFYNCNQITNMVLPDQLALIGSYAFGNCGSLVNIKIPDSVAQISSGAFQACQGLKTVELNAPVAGSSMFSGCTSLSKVTMGNNVKSIGNSAFEGCSSLTQIYFGSNVTELGDSAFQGCKALKTVNLNEKMVKIGYRAFYDCQNLQVAVIPASVKVISSYAFGYCQNLKNVSLKNGVTTLSNYAFYNNSKLSSLYIPPSVVSIGDDTFYGTGLGNGTVYCERNSVAANTQYYPIGTKIAYGKPTVNAPSFAVKGIINGRSVTFKSDTKDAVIYYSTSSSNLTTADKSAANGTTLTFNNFYGTIYARAYYNGQWSNVSRLVLKIPVVNTPVITQSGGKVTIRTTTPNSIIYYTTNGTTPSPSNGNKIAASAGSFYMSGGTVKAVAVRSCFTNSSITTKSIVSNVNAKVDNPSFKVKGVVGGRTVTFKSSIPGSVIYYSTSSSITTNDKHVNNGGSATFSKFYGTIYARTYSNGKWSNVSRLILKIPTVNTPTIRRSYGYADIYTTTPNCTIYYTTNGTTPSPTNGRKISGSSGSVYVGYGTTVKAIAVRNCFSNSSVAEY